MNHDWTLVTAPTTEPISIEAAKSNLRVTIAAHDQEIARMIQSARSQAEEYLMRGLLTQVWRYVQDGWTDEIRLPRAAPLQAVVAVRYIDGAGAQQTLASSVYIVDTVPEPGLLRRAPNQVWPGLQVGRAAAVEVEYRLGWTTADAIPPAILEALHQLVTARFRARGDEAVAHAGAVEHQAAEALLAPHRVWWRAPALIET